MHRRTARGNKIGLAVTGLLLAVAGAALYAAHQGLYGSAGKTDVLYPKAAQRFVHDNGGWLWPVAAAVVIVVGLVFLRWLLVQPRADRLRGLSIDTDADPSAPAAERAAAGRTRMPARAVTDMVETDIVELRGVRNAAAGLSGHSDSPQLWLRVTTDADADVARIRHAITTTVLSDARACLELPDLPTYLRINVARREGAREVR